MAKNLSRTIITRVICLVFAITASIIVCALFLMRPGMNNNLKGMLSQMVYHQAYRPIVYRTLLPTTVELLSNMVPERKREELSSYIRVHPKARAFFEACRLESNYPVESLIAVVLIFASLLAFMITMLGFFSTLYAGPELYRCLVPTIAALGLPPWFAYTNYPYDFCTLFLTALCLLFLARSNWRAFIYTFIFACLNKETAILITVVFALFLYSSKALSRRTFVKLLLLQVFLYGVIRSLITYQFRENLGSMLEFHLYDHNIPLLKSWMTHGYHLGPLVIFLVMAGLIIYGWSTKPPLLRIGLIALPPLLIMCFFYGYFDEWRAYFDAYPAVLLLTLDPVGRLFGVRRRERIP